MLEGRITPTTFLVLNALDGPGAGPSGSLRNAINLADQSGDANDVIAITPSVRGSIALNSGELTIDTSLTVMNQSGGPLQIRQTTPGQRVFDVTSASLATRVNIGGPTGRESVTITGGNVSTGNGGGILVENPANVLTLTHVNLLGNSAGLASSSNTAQNGGGIDSSGRVVLVQSTVGTNQTSGDGGGIWAGAGVSMTASSVNANQAGTNGGGLYVNSGDMTMVSRSSVSGNSALPGTGGGLYVAAGNTTVSQSQIDGNRTLDVGGLNEVKGNVRVVKGSTVNQNSSTAPLNVSSGDFGGGGIYEGIGDVFVSASQVSDNHSVGMYSSGIVIGLGSVTVTARSRIDGNTNNGPGGGIAANFGGIVTVSGGSQVDDNTGSGNGGGIVNFAGPMGGVRVIGGSEVSHNTLTNFESLGQAVGVFLQLLAGTLGVDFTTATGGTSPAALTADITQLEQEVSPDGSLDGPSGFVVSGGGIGTLLGGSITVSGSHVDDNVSGLQVPAGNPHSIGIGGGLFSGLGTVTVKNSTVNGNTVQGSGGGIYNQGTLSVVNSTVARNHATAQGGGILNKGRMTLVHAKVFANTPDNIAPPA